MHNLCGHLVKMEAQQEKVVFFMNSLALDSYRNAWNVVHRDKRMEGAMIAKVRTQTLQWQYRNR